MEIDPAVLQLIGQQTLTIALLKGQIARLGKELQAERASHHEAPAATEDAEG